MPTNVILAADTAYCITRRQDMSWSLIAHTPLFITAARLMQHHHLSLCHSATRLHITRITKQVFSYCSVHWMLSQLQQIQLSIATILQVHCLQPRTSWERVHLIYVLSGINTETQHYRLAYCPNYSNIFVSNNYKKNNITTPPTQYKVTLTSHHPSLRIGGNPSFRSMTSSCPVLV